MRPAGCASFALSLLVLIAALVPVAAADPIEPLVDHVEKKADEAQEDPVGFAEDHASEEAVAGEAEWTRDYACFAAREAAKEAGQEPPEVPVCPAFEDAREEDPLEDEKADEAVADELGFDALAEARALVDDALGTLDEIVDDPGGALGALADFLERSVRAVKRIVDGAVGFVKDLVGLAQSGMLAVWDGLVWTASLPQLTGQWGVNAVADAGGLMLDGAKATAAWFAGGVGTAWESATSTTADAARFIGETAGSVTDALRESVRSIWGSPEPGESTAKPLEDATGPVDKETDRLLRDVDDTLGRL